MRALVACASAAIASATIVTTTPSLAQSYPAKPVRIIVPFAPGGPSDLLARTFGQKLSAAWGQPVVVDNRGGASGVLGTEAAAKSAPDGYTLLVGSNGTHGINASLYPRLPYDTVKDFAPITRLAQVPFIVVAHPSVPATNVRELVRLARARPSQVSCSTGGSPSQLAAELFRSMSGIRLLVVPYKGAALAIGDVIGGQVSMTFAGVALALPQVQAGRLRALGVTGPSRSAVAPDVPTVSEAGVPGFEVTTWYGLFAPAGTPAAVVERLNGDVIKAGQLADVRERLLTQAFEPLADTPAAFDQLIRAEISKWARVVKESGARVE